MGAGGSKTQVHIHTEKPFYYVGDIVSGFVAFHTEESSMNFNSINLKVNLLWGPFPHLEQPKNDTTSFSCFSCSKQQCVAAAVICCMKQQHVVMYCWLNAQSACWHYCLVESLLAYLNCARHSRCSIADYSREACFVPAGHWR